MIWDGKKFLITFVIRNIPAIQQQHRYSFKRTGTLLAAPGMYRYRYRYKDKNKVAGSNKMYVDETVQSKVNHARPLGKVMPSDSPG